MAMKNQSIKCDDGTDMQPCCDNCGTCTKETPCCDMCEGCDMCGSELESEGEDNAEGQVEESCGKSVKRVAKPKNFIQDANLKEGSFTKWCKTQGYDGVTQECINEGLASKNATTRRRARLAQTFKNIAKNRKKKQ